jgi:hypothetical protein
MFYKSVFIDYYFCCCRGGVCKIETYAQEKKEKKEKSKVGYKGTQVVQ